MKNLLTVFILCFMCVLAMNAQTVVWENQKTTTNQDTSSSVTRTNTKSDTDILVPEAFETNIENLLNSWYFRYYVKQQPQSSTRSNLWATDEVYKDRLSRLPHAIEMPYNDIVKKYIEFYLRRGSHIENMLGLADFYFPMIEEILDENQLPLELKYLVIVESAMNPTALSRAGASGLWQFIVSTGKVYGLEINSLIDERRDPVKATHAACRYFKDMYDIYGDWHLVIASYNCGPGSVNKAIRRAGGKRNYWAIYDYLPRETRGYVPLFIAANYVMNYYAQHGLSPSKTNLPLATDTIMINDWLHLDQVAEMLNLDKEMIKALNPQYKRDIIPGHDKPRPLQLPSTSAYAFISLGDSVYRHRAGDLFANRTEPGNDTQSSSQERVVHRVQQGETMIAIAHKYGVTSADIRNWNGLRSSTVRPGNRLTIYADNGGVRISDNDSDSSEISNDNTTSNSRVVAANTKPANSNSSSQTAANFTRYKVKKGDTYSSIAAKHGVGLNALMKFNNTKSTKIMVGQTIKIPKG